MKQSFEKTLTKLFVSAWVFILGVSICAMDCTPLWGGFGMLLTLVSAVTIFETKRKKAVLRLLLSIFNNNQK